LCLGLLKLANVDSPLFLFMYVAYFADHRRDEIYILMSLPMTPVLLLILLAVVLWSVAVSGFGW